MTPQEHLKSIRTTYRQYVSFIPKEEHAAFRKEYFSILRDSPPDRHPETVAHQALFRCEVARNPEEYRGARELLDIRMDSP